MRQRRTVLKRGVIPELCEIVLVGEATIEQLMINLQNYFVFAVWRPLKCIASGKRGAAHVILA